MSTYADLDHRRALRKVKRQLDRIEVLLMTIGVQVSQQSDAIANLNTQVSDLQSRVSVDFAHMQDLLDQALALVAQANANDASDAQAIADLNAAGDALRAEAQATAQGINEAAANIQSVDPDASFPAPTPEPEPTPEPNPNPEPPVEENV